MDDGEMGDVRNGMYGVTLSSDAAIQSRAADILGRRRFAERMAATIRDRVGEESVVIALMGPWGCGKTSIKNMVIESLAEDPDTKPHVVEFEPWLWRNQEDLTAAFFREVGIALGREDAAGDGEARAAKWNRYAANFAVGATALKALAGFATFASTGDPVLAATVVAAGKLGDVADPMKKGSEALAAQAAGAKKTLAEQRTELRASLLELERPVLVVMDDLDRLTASEIPLIFQLVKANANFPNIVYLLLFQRESVERSLDSVAPGGGNYAGREYLEKIVQVPFDVPLAPKGTLHDAIGRGLTDALGPELDRRVENDRRWRNLLGTRLLDYFENLRDVRRFLNAFSFTVGMFRGEGDSFEVNPMDLLALEVIRFFEPDVYARLPIMKRRLLEPKGDYTYTKQEEEVVRADMRALLESATPRHRDSLREMLKDLFPAGAWSFHEDKQPYWLGSVATREALRELHACHPAFFDRYFHLAVPQDDLPQADLNRLLAATGDGDRLLGILRELARRGVLPVALDRFASYADEINLDDSWNVVSVLLSLDPELIRSKSDMMHFDSRDATVASFIKDLLLRDEDVQRRSKLLRRALEEAETLWLPCYAAHWDERDEEALKRRSEFVMTEDDVAAALRACADRIRTAGETGDLERHPMLAALLYRWRAWGDAREMQSYVNRLVETELGLIRFLTAWVSVSHESNSSDRISHPKKFVNLTSVGEFIAVDSLAEKVRVLIANPPTDGFGTDGQEAAALFLDTLARGNGGSDS
ncbi:MAG: AAA family ATPase [Fibrella sp.]|nr:AAA family ATPase [Armatimonadota bacterium]